MAVELRNKVILSVDESDYAEYAFDWYVKYLHHPENEIIGVHVAEGFDVTKAQQEVSKKGQLKESMEKQYSKITELEERYQHKLHKASVKGTILSVPGKSPGQAIIDTANEENAFCIVMGTRGRSKLKKALLGSVSDFVVKNADIPVVVVRRKTTSL